jgi:VIT1/CCC1 family predicted Fe2+/Mn2+ transporter
MALKKRYSMNLVFAAEFTAVMAVLTYFTGPLSWQSLAIMFVLNMIMLVAVNVVRYRSNIAGWFRSFVKDERHTPVTNPNCL